MIPNKKTRAYIFIPLAILVTWFIEFKHLEIFEHSILSYAAQWLFSCLFFFAFWLGLCHFFNKILSFFGYEE